MLELLRMMIQWDFYGFEIVGTAQSAGEAMNLYYDTHPDIIITDICMDGINGIEFLNKVRLQDNRVKFIIISAYERFEYAQKALKLNVDGYLLKPVSSEELLNQLLEIEKKLKQDEDYKVQLQSLRKSLGELEEKYRQSQLLEIWQKGVQATGKLTEDRGFWMIMGIRTIIRDEIVFIERDLNRIGPLRINVIFADDGEFSVFLYAENKQYLLDASVLLQDRYCEGERSVLCGVSSIRRGTGNLAEQCEEAKEALDELFYEEEKCYTRYRKRIDTEETLIKIEESQFMLWLVNNETEQWKKALDHMLDSLKKRNASRKEAVANCVEIKKITAAMASDERQIEEMDKIQQEMGRASRIKELRELAVRAVEIVSLDNMKSKKNRKLIVNARDYMKRYCFEEDFSMDSLADFLKISKSYLSKLYKEETGESVWTYVIRLRIAKAKEMLISTDATGYTIARAIGYTSEYHFSRAFTKEVGMSPSAYKKLYMKIK